MRTTLMVSSLALLATLTACATPGQTGGYPAEIMRLSDDCAARGGILAPTGQQTGRPQVDNVCELRQGGGRLPGR